MNQQTIELKENNRQKTYKVKEIAEILNLSERTAYQYCKDTDDFKVLKIGRSVRINKQSFDEWFSC